MRRTPPKFSCVFLKLAIRIAKRFAATLDSQREQILKRELVGTYGHDTVDSLTIDLVDGGLALTKAVVNGTDLFKLLRLGEGEGDYVPLWPTGEPSVWRLAIGFRRNTAPCTSEARTG